MGPKDEPVPIDEEIPDSERAQILMSPCLESQGYQLEVNLIKGEIIEPNADLIGKVDPFVTISFLGAKQHSKTVYDTIDPEFNQKFLIPLCLPVATDTIKIEVFDFDSIGNDLICTS